MGRKPILANQRSIPVSFSVKPALYDRIENMAYDQRFTRSKFLQEAVHRYINFIETKDTPTLHDMSVEQRVAIGANALLEAHRDGDKISSRIVAHLKKQLEVFEMKNLLSSIDENIAQTKRQISAAAEIKTVKSDTGEYRVHRNEKPVAKIFKQLNKWHLVELENDELIIMTKTLKSAKSQAEIVFGVV